MEKLTIKLKQHTPLLHFQPTQDGATLRASEVKPKLDKFILTRLGKGDYDAGIKIAEANKWLIGSSNALNYKMRISANGTRIVSDPNEIIGYNANGRPKKKLSPLFFANLGDCVEKKYYVFSDILDLTIVTTNANDSILNFIKDNIGDFFYKNNFGTRQTKGFGSFTAPKAINNDIKGGNIPSKLYFDIDADEDDYEKVFEELEWFYKSIRSGINDCSGPGGDTLLYFKSLMFSYAKYLDQQWEKKTIKENFYPTNLSEQLIDHPNSELLAYSTPSIHYTYKDCLGFSTLEHWKYPYDKMIKKESSTVERMKSPILLKPTYMSSTKKWRVYIIPSSLPNSFYDALITVTDGTGNSIELNVDRRFTVHGYIYYLFKKNIKGVYNINILNNFLYCKSGRGGKSAQEKKRDRILAIFAGIRANYNK